MGEQILDLFFKLAILGAIIFLISMIFSENIKDFHIAVDRHSIEINSVYYME